MFQKLLIALLVLFILCLFFYPGILPRLLRRLGRTTGDVGRMGKELVTGEEVEGSPLARHEVRAGEMVALKVLTENPTSPDEALQSHIGEIGARLAQHARRKHIPYRFMVLDSDEPNAFAVPGGSVFITRPLIELCANEPDTIACVLGHEIIHIDRLHAIRTLAASTVVQTGFRIVSLGRGALLSRMVGGIQDLLVKGYRHDQELEADLFGSRLAGLAGFNPRGLTLLLEQLRQAQARQHTGKEGAMAELFQYFKSHPPLSMRLTKLREELG